MLWSNVYKWIFLVLLPARNSQGAMVYCSLRIYRHCTWRVWKRLVVSVRLCFPVMVAIVAFSWRHGHAHAHVLALSATFLHKFTIFNFEVDLRRHESTTASERERERAYYANRNSRSHQTGFLLRGERIFLRAKVLSFYLQNTQRSEFERISFSSGHFEIESTQLLLNSQKFDLFTAQFFE